MTGGSRRARDRNRTYHQKHVAILVVGAWHITCFPFFAMACFDFDPVPWDEANEPPLIVEPPDSEDGKTLTLSVEDTPVYALAYDPDTAGNEVAFFWKLGNQMLPAEALDPEPGPDGLTYHGSLIFLDPVADQDGETLTVDVWDAGGAHELRTWLVEVL